MLPFMSVMEDLICQASARKIEQSRNERFLTSALVGLTLCAPDKYDVFGAVLRKFAQQLTK